MMMVDRDFLVVERALVVAANQSLKLIETDTLVPVTGSVRKEQDLAATEMSWAMVVERALQMQEKSIVVVDQVQVGLIPVGRLTTLTEKGLEVVETDFLVVENLQGKV